jgi:hypothetical protein
VHSILPDGVTVAQQTLNLFVMVQIHVGQPFSIRVFKFILLV